MRMTAAKKMILAIPMADPASPPKPKRAATRAMMKKVTAQLNIVIVSFDNLSWCCPELSILEMLRGDHIPSPWGNWAQRMGKSLLSRGIL